jgi:short-subunit dehydrogenase
MNKKTKHNKLFSELTALRKELSEKCSVGRVNEKIEENAIDINKAKECEKLERKIEQKEKEIENLY